VWSAGARGRAWRRSAVKAGACDVEGVGGRRGGFRVSVCVYAVVVCCFRVEGRPGCSVWRGVGERWGVDVVEVEGWSSRLAGAVAAAVSLSPRTLLLAEMGLDQASNMAHAWHARMDEAKLCRDCLSDEHRGYWHGPGDFLYGLVSCGYMLHTTFICHEQPAVSFSLQ